MAITVTVQPYAVDTVTAASVLGRSPRTLANWRAAGTGPPYRVAVGKGGPVMYLVSDLENWLQNS
ncbi:helix-turn-helix domain-containing protein [Gordonia amicalis]|uniref:helix-turn-helix domain-containing protein n=1 Tax=Gordonia amicalis TaxID=89053 RepID=UPI0022B2EBEC|nr:helix-turn-helix domain-containing protein [Gordonia amicalis]MCZ4652698.1 helix-turn-helix domain-containing protein [Gordonia amicalis]